MKKEKKFHSFATRLSQWVMLVLFVMAGYRGAYRKTKQAYTQLWYQLY